MTNEKFCTKCGSKFVAIGREVICPKCKAAAAEESKRAAVLRTKRASWNGESVPVRISGRASTLIREYGAEKSLPFAQALDELLQSTSFFVNLGTEWNTIQPYRSHRRDKATSTTETPQDTPQDKPQDKQDKPQDKQDKPQDKPVKPIKTTKSTKTTKTTKTTAKK